MSRPEPKRRRSWSNLVMDRRLPIVLGAMLLAWTSIAASKPAATEKPAAEPEVRGRVLDAEGRPAKKAIVRIAAEVSDRETRGPRARPETAARPARLETAEDGSFEARGLAGKSFVVRVDATGFAPFTRKQVPS